MVFYVLAMLKMQKTSKEPEIIAMVEVHLLFASKNSSLYTLLGSQIPMASPNSKAARKRQNADANVASPNLTTK